MALSACNATLGNWVSLLCTGAEASASASLLGGGREGTEGGKNDGSGLVKERERAVELLE